MHEALIRLMRMTMNDQEIQHIYWLGLCFVLVIMKQQGEVQQRRFEQIYGHQ
jgi:hypothetical protein